ncbi:MAG: M48 family metallopeptidase [Desulfovibrionaceae bacterium]
MTRHSMTRRTLSMVLGVLTALAFCLVVSCAELSSLLSTSMPYSSEVDSARAKAADAAAKAETVIQAAQRINRTFADITPEQEYYLSRAVTATLLATYPTTDSRPAYDYVNLLGQTLAMASDRPSTFGGYHFIILDSPEINAMAAPGGHILVTKGLIRCCESEDALAAVLAHEISHVALRHGVKAIMSSRLNSEALDLALTGAKTLAGAELAAVVNAFGDSVADIVQTLIQDGYSRSDEYAADAAAVRILARTGYNPRALADMLAIMGERLRADAHDFSGTHPPPRDRILALDDMLEGYPDVDTPQLRQSRFHTTLQGI